MDPGHPPPTALPEANASSEGQKDAGSATLLLLREQRAAEEVKDPGQLAQQDAVAAPSSLSEMDSDRYEYDSHHAGSETAAEQTLA